MNWFRRELQVLNVNIFSDQFEICEDRKIIVIILFLNSCSNSNIKSNDFQTPDTANINLVQKNINYKSCSVLYNEARKIDSILLHQNDLNKNSATTAIQAFINFANFCKDDSLAAVYLIKTAQVSIAIKNIPQAKIVLDRCIEDYPNFKDKSAALFLLAQLFDEPTYLNNEAEAKRLYEKIIAEFPKSDWALSAKGAIAFIGKSDKQILEELKKKSN